MTHKQQSLAEAFVEWETEGFHRATRWPAFSALVARVRALEAENAHNAHWHDHYGTLSDKLEAERDSYAKLAAAARRKALEECEEITTRHYDGDGIWLEIKALRDDEPKT